MIPKLVNATFEVDLTLTVEGHVDESGELNIHSLTMAGVDVPLDSSLAAVLEKDYNLYETSRDNMEVYL